MKAPESLETLVEYGIIQEVLRPLMSGKEAQVYVVLAGGEECVAKVYKEADQRTFKHRTEYTEGRRTRNTRDERAMSKRSQHGRKKDEDAWRATEVEMIYRLRDAGVRVPEPINFVEGVLVMELVKDGAGDAAPRLGDLTFSPREAREIHQTLIREVVRMLCAGVVHGDLSDFNVLMSHQGPVVIDFPQSVDPTQNANGKKLLLRDVENLHRFLARFAPDEPVLPYGEEIWSLFETNRLRPDTEVSGRYDAPEGETDTEEVMAVIEDASREHEMRRGGWPEDDFEESEGSGVAAVTKPVTKPVTTPIAFRKVVDFPEETQPRPAAKKRAGKKRKARPASRRRTTNHDRVPPARPAAEAVAKSDASPSGRRRRRGGKSIPEPPREAREGAPRGESPTAEVAGPTRPGRRRRNRRGQPRSEPNARTRSEEAKAGSHSGSGEKSGDHARGDTGGRNSGQTARRAGAKRPASSESSSGSPPVVSEGVGNGSPPRRRRRRPRKATSPR